MPETIIATMTYDKGSEIESKVILESLGELVKVGIPINCVHGGSLQETEQGLRDLGIEISQQEERGLGAAINQTIQEAYAEGPSIIVYTEPNKHSLFWPQIPKLTEPIEEGDADLTFACRDAESMETYPFNRKIAEKIFNMAASHETGVYGDYVYGTKAFTLDIAPIFDDFYETHKKDNWVQLMGPVFRAMRNEHMAEMVTVHAPALEEEQMELSVTDTQYRIEQAMQNYEALLLGYDVPSEEKMKYYEGILIDVFKNYNV